MNNGTFKAMTLGDAMARESSGRAFADLSFEDAKRAVLVRLGEAAGPARTGDGEAAQGGEGSAS
jgi:hypothetical protein